MKKSTRTIFATLIVLGLAIDSVSAEEKIAPSKAYKNEEIATRAPASNYGYRGELYESDPGAPLDSRWPDLFAETPNYRAFGKAVIGGNGEKFRWVFGPMWYRGRLGPKEVKVFVIGQEGAQDENVSNRSFTGSTGTRMQKFLQYLGIDRSYLFMNTFVYTITGQYSLFDEDAQNPAKIAENKNLLWLAQSQDSVVVEHRHKLFDYMLEQNEGTLSLVIGVGTAGKDSAATWARHHGVECNSSKLSSGYCYGTTGKLKGVMFVGVKHPGAASAKNGGEAAAESLKKDFNYKAQLVSRAITEKRINLSVDPGMKRNFSQEFKYGYASIPHRDFAFGTPWVFGLMGTTSNRRSEDAIQFYSDNGCYNNKAKVNGRCVEEKTENLQYDVPKDLLTSAPVEMQKGIDIPNESPKSSEGRRKYDQGPSSNFAKLLVEYFTAVDYKILGVTSHTSFGHQGIYRGRLDNAQVLVLADQFDHDDMVSGRALTGSGGQYLQSFLKAMGATNSYAILRTLPVDTLDLNEEKRNAIAQNQAVVSRRNDILKSILNQGNTKLVITVGNIAKEVASQYNFSGLKVINLTSPFEANHALLWNSSLSEIKNLGLKFDTTGSFAYEGKVSIIPREDLPAYTRWWMGTSGSRVARAYTLVNGKKVYHPDYYKVFAPKWADRWQAGLLNSTEKSSVSSFANEGANFSTDQL